MSKTFEALERYRKEKKQFAEIKGLGQAGRKDRAKNSSIPEMSKKGSIRRREFRITEPPAGQVFQNERNLLYRRGAEDESQRYDNGCSTNLPIKQKKPGHQYKPQLKIPSRTTSNPDRIIVNRSPDNLTDQFKLCELKKLFAKQIVSNLKSGIIQSIIKYKYFLVIRDYLRYAGGELLKFENGCFCRLNFKSKAMLSILLDRKGYLVNFLQPSKNRVARRNEHAVPFNILNVDRVKKLELMLVRNIFNAADLNAIRKALTAIFDITFYDKIECRGGTIVDLNGKVAYELLVDLIFGFSIFMDNYGNLLDVSAVENLNVWEKVIRDYSIHQNWLPSINLFKNGPSNLSTAQLA